MKRLILLLCCMLALSGCSDKDDTVCNAPTVYSFSGESEDFALTGGQVTINGGTACSEKETIEGGKLTAKDASRFGDITAFSASLYVMDKSERFTLLAHSHKNESGDSVSPSCNVGSISGSPTLFGTRLLDGEDFREGFFCEVVVTRTDGQKETFTVPLTLKKAS